MMVSSILLIAMTLLAFTLCIFALRRAIKAAFISKRSVALIVALGAILTAYLFYNLRLLQAADWAQILLVLGLVMATSIYALSAARQADASVKMAQEMREQAVATRQQAEASVKMAEEMRDARYDALHPIIDIVEQRVEPTEMATRAYIAKEGIFPKKLSCRLRNIGVGPAIEVYSFIEDARGETCRWDFGSIPVAIGEEEMGYTCDMPLSLQQRGEHKALVVCYKDVYGRWFESSREVRLGAVNPDPLQIRQIPEGELPK